MRMKTCHGCNSSWDVAVANCPDCGEPGNDVMASPVPGMIAKHAIITYVCRDNRGEAGAFDEAAARMKARYLESLKKNEFSRFHLVLTVERS